MDPKNFCSKYSASEPQKTYRHVYACRANICFLPLVNTNNRQDVLQSRLLSPDNTIHCFLPAKALPCPCMAKGTVVRLVTWATEDTGECLLYLLRRFNLFTLYTIRSVTTEFGSNALFNILCSSTFLKIITYHLL